MIQVLKYHLQYSMSVSVCLAVPRHKRITKSVFQLPVVMSLRDVSLIISS